ncbi:MAG: phosphonate C-P lyase system protein PhnH [Acetobacteraceae bacterium]|nr:phosphonate C-P lyase system protein PhnH [Acetobacteraceae bacterium]
MNIDLPGFADPVAQAQSSFRALLDAMARPGTIRAAGAGLMPPSPLDPATAAVLLTLIDGDARLHIAADCAPARDWLVFHCGTMPCPDPATAGFVVATALPDLATLSAGSDEAPESSATLVLQVAALGTGTKWRLAGPGLKEPAILRVTGLPDDFAARWAPNHALFPRGVDLVLCAGTALAAVPRTVAITEG